MLFAIGFVSLFVAGGITGLVLGQTSLDFFFHDTYFVSAHFHLVMGVASIFGMFAATYFWFPKMFGRMMNEGLGKLHFWITFIGVYAIFVPFHAMGMLGMPRRYAGHDKLNYLQSIMPMNRFISWVAFITIAAARQIFAAGGLAGCRISAHLERLYADDPRGRRRVRA